MAFISLPPSPIFPGTPGAAGVSNKGAGTVHSGSCSGHDHQHDTVSLNGNSGANNAAQIRTLTQDVARRNATDAQVNRMMVTQGPSSATPQDAGKIREELSKMDPAVLRTLANQGTTIRVVGMNDNLFEAGLLRPIAQKDFAANLQSDRAGIRSVYGDASKKYDAKIKAAEEAVAKLQAAPAPAPQAGGFGAFGGAFGAVSSPELQQAHANLATLRGQRDKELGTNIREASGGRWMEFSPSALKSAEKALPSDPQFAQMLDMQNNFVARTASLDQMAEMHGLKDPAQAKAFKDQVYSMNHERVDAGRKSMLEHMTRAAQGTGPDAEQAKKNLALYQKNPNAIPIQIPQDQRPLLVPNNFATTVKSGGKDHVAPMTLHDVSAYHNWSDKDGKANNPSLGGQFFFENGRSDVIVRREELNNSAGHGFTLTHEMGHAVENAVMTTAPKIHGTFDANLRNSHETASPFEPSNGNGNFGFMMPNAPVVAKDPNRRAVSTYAETNSHEFFAEGYAAYTHDPERLKAMDPKLFALVAQGNKALGGP